VWLVRIACEPPCDLFCVILRLYLLSTWRVLLLVVVVVREESS
jgi:hypothetical protein